MKIAIHQDVGSFSDRWISYCEEENIPYKIVNCYDNDIVSQLSDCNGLMWHWILNDYKAILFARQLSLSLEKRGMNIFPNVNSSWHYNDKLGQKYLLEAIDAPLVRSYVFYTKKEALEWLETATFPKVFKLRGGSASVNVSLVKSKTKAKRLIIKAFGTGFSPIDKFNRVKNRIWDFQNKRTLPSFVKVIGGLVRIFVPNEVERFSHNEKGYIYFQDFIANNEYDTRLVVVGDKCFGVRRFCRKGDFRASGSGVYDANPSLIDKRCIQIAFSVAKFIGSQSIAFDFVQDNEGPKIVEISYCFPLGAPDSCTGYWDSNLVWHDEMINAEIYMIKDFVEKCRKTKTEKVRKIA
jgi:glutathione synthase/RimK-type ligase-like ATP-grasp enzyme